MDKIPKLKEIVKELDVIPYWNKNPHSETLRRIIKKQKNIWEAKDEEAIKSAITLKHLIWILVNKTSYIVDDKERVKFNNIEKELEKLLQQK